MKSRTTRLLSAVVAVGFVVGSSVVGSQAAVADSGGGSTLTGGDKDTSLVASAAVTTADKEKWTMTFAADQESGEKTLGVTVQIERSIGSANGGYEAHEWDFTVPKSSFTFSTSTRKATLNTGSSANPVASINLKFAGSTPKKSTCTTGSQSSYPGTLSGKLTLATGLAKGGTIGGSSVKFTAKSPQVIVDSNCVTPDTPDECTAGIGFGAIGSALSLLGFPGEDPKHQAITVLKQVSLKAPAHATRSDEGGMLSGPLPTVSSDGKTLTVKTASSGPLTGSVTFSGVKEGSDKSKCTVGKTKYTITDTSYFGSAKSPKASPITAHTALTGVLTMPTSLPQAFYDVMTRK